MIRELDRVPTQNNDIDSIFTKDPFADMLGTTKTSEDKDKDKLKKPYTYSYKEVSNKIARAKNSNAAAQAMLSAKRKVLEVRRKIANGEGDAEELQFALTHATRMEMVARKKKHHLEQEEMVEITRKRDERLDQIKEAAENIKDAIIEEQENKVSEAEDEIFEEREAMIEEAQEELEEKNEEVTDEMMAEMNEEISELGEEMLEQLEETMEMLEELEMLDPHMDEEQLDKVKKKHRASEDKALMKADMDYLKSMVKHQMDQMGSSKGLSFGGGSSAFSGASFSAAVGTEVSAPAAEVAAPSIDVSA